MKPKNLNSQIRSSNWILKVSERERADLFRMEISNFKTFPTLKSENNSSVIF